MGSGLDPTVVRDFLIALLIGALLGIDREKHKATEGQTGSAGLRTFVLFAEAGAVSAWLARQQGDPTIFVVTVLAVAALTLVGYALQVQRDAEAVGLTTETAAMLTCLLGGMTLYGQPEIAVALAIATSALLTFKQPLHALVARLGTDDLYAATKLLVATFIVLPLLPDRPVDPWGALNPYELWWLVILISSLSLVGYVAVRWFGTTTGTLVTGVFGGLVSSTAVTLAFSRQSRTPVAGNHAAEDALGAGLLLAWAIMFVRVLVEVGVVHAPLLSQLLPGMITMGAVALLAASVFSWRAARGAGGSRGRTPEVPLRNPFSLSSAVRFALLFAAVLLLVELAQRWLPGRGVQVVAAIAGLTDVDAITLSMASFARDGGNPGTASAAIVIAALTNTLVKGGLVFFLGSRPLARRVLVAGGVLLASGVIALLSS